VQVIYLHHVQKSYSVFQVETSQQNLQAVFTGKPHNSWSLNPYFVLFRALDWATDAKAAAFLLWLGITGATLQSKVRFATGNLVGKNVFIVTRLLICSRRIKWKEKGK